jgi:hypothetical protein
VRVVIQQFRSFLRGTKTSERLREQPELRAAISYPTGLERPVADALLAGRDVVVTGSAGGGKTQLVEQVASLLTIDVPEMPFSHWAVAEPPGPHIKYIPDLTAVPSGRRTRALTRSDRTRAVLIAANEGAIGRVDGLARVLGVLHEMQSGRATQLSDAPVVVDLAGFDPFDGAIQWLLGLDLLSEVIATEPCCVDVAVCPRRMAWAQLQNEEVRQRVAGLLGLSVGPGEVRFRQLWDLIGDIALGGDCSSVPPTSPWYWRLFYGDSRLARRVAETIPLHLAALPGDDARLFYGDWMAIHAQPLAGVEFLPLAVSPSELDANHQHDAMDWLHAQIALIVDEPMAFGSLRQPAEDQLIEGIRGGDAGPLIGAMNRYLKYQLAEHFSEQELELWMDLSTDRSIQKKPHRIFSIGRIPKRQLQIARSQLVGNLADVGMPGTRYHLTCGDQSLRLDDRLLRALVAGKSVRMADRQHDDVEWAMFEFYVGIAGGVDAPLGGIDFGKSFDRLAQWEWSIDADGREIEPRV